MTVELGFAPERVDLPAHVCLFTIGPHDVSALAAFVRLGLDRPDEAIILTGPAGVPAALRSQVETELRRGLEAATRAHRLVLVDGERDADMFLMKLIAAVRQRVRDGAQRVRVLGRVGWDVGGWPAPEDQLWIETSLGAAAGELPVVFVCSFDVTNLPGPALLYSGLEAHPLISVNGHLVKNPAVLDRESLMAQRLIRLPWLRSEPAASPQPHGTHACAFFMDRDEEYATLLPLLRDALSADEAAVHIVDPERRDDHLRRLANAGFDTPRLVSRGHMEIHDWRDTYLIDGRFDPDRMLSTLRELLASHPGEVQLIADMAWALSRSPGVEALVEYESRINETMPRSGDTVICTYDSARFPGAVALDILRAHPVVILAGVAQENHLYSPPTTLVPELRARIHTAG
jgi:DcmR-like sensory protein